MPVDEVILIKAPDDDVRLLNPPVELVKLANEPEELVVTFERIPVELVAIPDELVELNDGRALDKVLSTPVDELD